MATYTKSGSFGWAGGGKNGAVVDLWAVSRFGAEPAEDTAPPTGTPDAGPVVTGPAFGNPGAYTIAGIATLQDYYVRIQYGGHTYWGDCPAGTLGGQSGGTSPYVLTSGGSTITSGPVNPGLTIQFAPNAATTQNNGFLVLDSFNNPIASVGGDGGFKVFGDRNGATGTNVFTTYFSFDGTTNPASIQFPSPGVPGRGLGPHLWSYPGTPSASWVSGTTAVNDLWYDQTNGTWYTCVVSGGGTTAGTWIFDGGATIVNTVFTSNAYTLGYGDANTSQQASNASAATVTVPPNSSVNYPVGTIITFTQSGAGKIRLATGAGVTINCSLGGGFVSGNTGTRVQWSVIGIEQTAANTWILTGDFT